VKLLLITAVAIVAVIVGFAAGLELEKLRHAPSDVQQLLLARFIGIYYHAFKDHETSLPAQQRLTPEIDALSAKSATLKEELQKPSK
jgi:hypothetical protein